MLWLLLLLQITAACYYNYDVAVLMTFAVCLTFAVSGSLLSICLRVCYVSGL